MDAKLSRRQAVGHPANAFGDRLAMFYDGPLGDGIGHTGRDIGLPWLDLPLKVRDSLG